MATSNPQKLKEQLQNLHAHLTLIKTIKESEKQNEFYVLLQKAQQILGDLSPHIAIFYYQYGAFLLSKIQTNMEIFNPNGVPDAQEDDAFEDYDECYEDDSLEGQNGANNQNPEKKETVRYQEQKIEKAAPQDVQKTQKQSNDNNQQIPHETILYQDDCMQITEMDDKLKQKLADNPHLFQNAEKNEEEDLTDIEICYENFQAALSIYNCQLKKMDEGEESPLDRKESQRYKILIHGLLGELYSMDQKYDESIQQFRTVVRLASDYDNPETQRMISEAHFSAGNALLHQNNSGCEKLAIEDYISAVVCLIKYLREVEKYNTEKFEVPSLQKPRVDRYQYLPAPKDSKIVSEMKEVISMILDKIEDTYEQIGTRAAYENEKRKMEKEKEESVFKEVPKDVKVTNLGTFGNRKRSPVDSKVNGDQKGSILSGLNPNAPNSGLKGTAKIETEGKGTAKIDTEENGSKIETEEKGTTNIETEENGSKIETEEKGITNIETEENGSKIETEEKGTGETKELIKNE